MPGVRSHGQQGQVGLSMCKHCVQAGTKGSWYAFLMCCPLLRLMLMFSFLCGINAPPRAAVHYEKGDYDTAIADCDEAVSRGRELRADFTLVAK